MIGMPSTGSASWPRAGQWPDRSGCAPVGGLGRDHMDCADFVREAWVLAERPEVTTVVFATSRYGVTQRPDIFRLGDTYPYRLTPLASGNRWIFDPWAQALQRLHQRGKQVALVVSSPRGPLVDPRQRVERGLWTWHPKDQPSLDGEQLSGLVSEVDQRLREVAKTGQAELAAPFDSFCRPDGRCTARMPDGRPSFTDESHRSATFAARYIRLFDRYVVDPAPPAAPSAEPDAGGASPEGPPPGPHQTIGQARKRPSALPKRPPQLTTLSARRHDDGQLEQSSRTHIRPGPV
jgi:hypothetical protein